MRSCGGIGRHAGLRYQWETMRVRVPPGAPYSAIYLNGRSSKRTGFLEPFFFMSGRGGMADTLDLGSSAARRKGSSPFARTIFKAHTANLLLEECEFKSHKPRLGFWRNGLRD